MNYIFLLNERPLDEYLGTKPVGNSFMCLRETLSSNIIVQTLYNWHTQLSQRCKAQSFRRISVQFSFVRVVPEKNQKHQVDNVRNSNISMLSIIHIIK